MYVTLYLYSYSSLYRNNQQTSIIPGNCGASVKRVQSEAGETRELGPSGNKIQNAKVSVVCSLVVMVVGREQAARGAGGPGREVAGGRGHGGTDRPGVVNAHAAHKVVQAVARSHGQELGNGSLEIEDLTVLLAEHVLPNLEVTLGHTECGEQVHLDLGLILQGVAQLVLPLLGLLQQQIQLVIVHILPETHDLLLRGVGPLLSPRQLVPQLVDLSLQLGHGRIILGLLGRLQFGLDSILLVLALGLKLDLKVGPLLFLLGKLLLELLPGLLLAGPGADQAVDPSLQLGLLNQEAGDLRLKSSLA